jgi:hypothetical protein
MEVSSTVLNRPTSTNPRPLRRTKRRGLSSANPLEEVWRIAHRDFTSRPEEPREVGEVPESLRGYIEFERWARDQELNGDIFTLGERAVHVFWTQ